MPESTAIEQQGPWEGSRCLAGPGGSWRSAIIRRVNEDGTFQVEFDLKEMVLLPRWYGVTLSEISFHDQEQWATAFAALSPDGRKITLADFSTALTRLDFHVEVEATRKYWVQGCQKLFPLSQEQAESQVLNQESSYQFFLHLIRQAVYPKAPGRPAARVFQAVLESDSDGWT